MNIKMYVSYLILLIIPNSLPFWNHTIQGNILKALMYTIISYSILFLYRIVTNNETWENKKIIQLESFLPIITAISMYFSIEIGLVIVTTVRFLLLNYLAISFEIIKLKKEKVKKKNQNLKKQIDTTLNEMSAFHRQEAYYAFKENSKKIEKVADIYKKNPTQGIRLINKERKKSS